MSTYYLICNFSKREFLDPDDVHPKHATKRGFAAGPIGNLLAHCVLWEGWARDDVRMVGDDGDLEHYYDLKSNRADGWTNVTNYYAKRMPGFDHVVAKAFGEPSP